MHAWSVGFLWTLRTASKAFALADKALAISRCQVFESQSELIDCVIHRPRRATHLFVWIFAQDEDDIRTRLSQAYHLGQKWQEVLYRWFFGSESLPKKSEITFLFCQQELCHKSEKQNDVDNSEQVHSWSWAMGKCPEDWRALDILMLLTTCIIYTELWAKHAKKNKWMPQPVKWQCCMLGCCVAVVFPREFQSQCVCKKTWPEHWSFDADEAFLKPYTLNSSADILSEFWTFQLAQSVPSRLGMQEPRKSVKVKRQESRQWMEYDGMAFGMCCSCWLP